MTDKEIIRISRFLSLILRHQPHLSSDPQTAAKVGQRRGRPVVLTIRSGQMHRQGHVFCPSANGVWLVDHVPAEFIDFKT